MYLCIYVHAIFSVVFLFTRSGVFLGLEGWTEVVGWGCGREGGGIGREILEGRKRGRGERGGGRGEGGGERGEGRGERGEWLG